MSGKRASIAAGVAGLLAIGGMSAAAASAAAATPAATGPHWHIVKSVKTGSGAFTAVVATGKTTGWAFSGWVPGSGPTAWQRNGGTWSKVKFPGKTNELVVAAAASSPSDVWAVTDILGAGSRVLRWNGHQWSVVKVFSQQIGGLAVPASKDVWVFGGQTLPTGLGVWHYNGHTWSRVGKSLSGGSVLSDRDVWAFSGTSVDHWNGHKWTSTSVKSLLPAKQLLNDPQVVDILALSDSNVYATGNGDTQDAGGPIVVLHYDGRKWSKVAEGGYGYGGEMSSDGSHGLWIPMPGALGARSFMLHYAAGKLTRIALPQNTLVYGRALRAIARVPGTTQQLAGGFIPAKNFPGITAEVILQYS